MRSASFSLIFSAFLCACQYEGNSNSPTPHLVADSLTLTAAVDPSDCQPLFHDDGTLDSLYRAAGYSYGPDIVNAARSGDADAKFLLAQMLSYGIAGATPNLKQAFKLYVELADNGNAQSQAIAGFMLFHGKGTDENPTEGLRLISEAANQDCPLAFLFLGEFYASRSTPLSDEDCTNAKLFFAKAQAEGLAVPDVYSSLLNN